MARKINKQQEKEFYKTNHPITKYFHLIHTLHKTKTKKPLKQNPDEINKTVETQKKQTPNQNREIHSKENNGRTNGCTYIAPIVI